MPSEISAPLHFRTLLNGHTYMIADFYATWCPPCKQIAPIYNQLANTHAAAGKFAFVKVNVDEQREIAAQYGITAMPTFLLFKDGKQIEEIRGADPRKIKAAVEKASTDLKSQAVPAAQPAAPTNGTNKAEEKKDEENGTEEKEEKTVSGSYGMTGGSSWKMSLN
jgi:thioredoxin 1